MALIMQDLGIGLPCGLPPPDFLFAPRNAACRVSALRHAPAQPSGVYGFGKIGRRSDRLATGCQPSEPAAPSRGRQYPPADGSTLDAADQQTAAEQVDLADSEELMKLVALLPADMQHKLRSHPDFVQLIEIVIDLGRKPIARFLHGEAQLADEVVSHEFLEMVVSQVGEFGEDNRAGINRTLHRISCLRNRDGGIVGLTCRVGRAVTGSAALIADLASSGKSILLLGRPGSGKTTVLRDVSRMLAAECRRRVVIVDTSNEIGGDGDVPHAFVAPARRMQVPSGAAQLQHRVMIEAVENHMPEVVVIDEIGTEAEAVAARTIAQRGVQLIGTAHGNELANVLKNPSLQDLVGGIESVTLGDEEARRRGVQKLVLERAAAPTFDVAVEILERHRWRVHTDVGDAVDELLRGRDLVCQVRSRLDDGMVRVTTETASASESGGLDRPRPFGPFGGSSAPDSPPRSSRTSSMQSNQAEDMGALQLYLFGVEAGQLHDVAERLDVTSQVTPTQRLQGADAVLAVRTKVSQGSWVRQAARDAGVPIFVVKTAAPSNLTRALRTLLGFDPSAGGTFAGWRERNSQFGSSAPGMSHTAELPDAEYPAAVSSNVTSRAVAENETEAMDEARLAVQQIVLARQQPSELLPRAPPIIALQIKMLQEFNLQHEIIGHGLNSRLRILPALKARLSVN